MFFFDIQFKLCFYIHLELVNNSFVTFWRRFTETKLTTLINFSLIYFVCSEIEDGELPLEFAVLGGLQCV